MASYAYTFSSGDTVTPNRLNDARTVSNIVDADISASAAIAGSKIASGINASNITTGTLPIAQIADGSVTLAKLVTAVQQALLPAGAVQAFAMNSAPSGWLAANGTAVSRTTYAALFTAIGTTYGVGDGSTTFALPDLRGIFIRGSGSQTISSVVYSAATFGTKQQDAVQAHTHTSAAAASLIYTLTSSGGNLAANYGDATGAMVTGRSATETRPVNIALLYCIKF